MGLSGKDSHMHKSGGLAHLSHVSLGPRLLSISRRSVLAAELAILFFMLASKAISAAAAFLESYEDEKAAAEPKKRRATSIASNTDVFAMARNYHRTITAIESVFRTNSSPLARAITTPRDVGVKLSSSGPQLSPSIGYGRQSVRLPRLYGRYGTPWRLLVPLNRRPARMDEHSGRGLQSVIKPTK
ncbi:hypothetical protein THAOC_11136 [Thalassiosira oceanica]|uniref:Uncharacterized protein n=1 Tax=Thalassiosira oceanica TaxID=159749 RepID=K0SNF5_THAOC|nr:hypothetical protein THAOC_11136 [Thalassiosira oceanica]|eukprot:EJK67788.1 hypothetical protein THAOC_11136 [Thalassiosira oceanica]